jgi:hypothetical protein
VRLLVAPVTLLGIAGASAQVPAPVEDGSRDNSLRSVRLADGVFGTRAPKLRDEDMARLRKTRPAAAPFHAIYAHVQQAVRDGLTLEQTKAQVKLAALKPTLTYGDERAGRAFDSFMAAAVDRMYEELTSPR